MSEYKPPTVEAPETQIAALRPDLVFRESPYDSCLVFAPLERAAAVDRIHRALESATWGEFRRKMDPEEYARLLQVMSAADTDALDDVPREPGDHEPFSPDSLPGFSDGDYPPWLALELERNLPNAILKRFATHELSWVNGPFCRIDVKHCDAILKALADSRLTVQKREDLVFW
jgi:hypothetical protein